MKNPNMNNLKSSLQKVLGSANNEDFFDVTSDKNEEENLKEEVEEITEDEVNEAMDEEQNDDTSSDDSNDGSDGDIETEISIDEGEEVNDDDTNDDDDGFIENSMDEEQNDDSSDDDSNDDSNDTSAVEDDENDDDGDFSSDDNQTENITEEDVVEVNNIEEDDNDDYSEEDNVVEVNDVQEVTDDNMDGIEDDFNEISDDDIDNASGEIDDDDDNAEEITDEDLINSGDVEEITDEDIENAKNDENDENEEADSSANNITIDDVATGSASELLASHGYQFETDACGKLCITGCDESENCVEVVEEVPDDIQIAPSDVNLVLHESASQDPFYSVLIKGKPVASIHLKDQDENEDADKRSFFISSDYPKALTDAMVKGGVNSVLDSVKAKRFVASVKNTALAQTMKAEAKKEMEEEVKASAINTKEKFIESVRVALAGMNKNFFNTENDLKGAVYQAFANFGASKEVALRETEKVFAEAEPFFEAVVGKAEELMGFNEDSFKTIASAISTSGVGNREVETFESRLVKGNNPVVASAFADTDEKVTASATSHKKLTFKKHIS